ncbi:MAG: hypothetical protein RLO52_26245 [Sandaracinaceae bacterium]|nr:MAG: hypothetical protein EVA89_14745 [Sandaracinaceae bacterium]
MFRKLLTLAAIAGLTSCTPGSSGPPAEDDPEVEVEILREIQLTQNARLPESRDGSLVDVEVFEDRLVFIYEGTPKLALESGHVVSGVLHGGYLRRLVERRELSPERIEWTTEHAELGELIGDGHFIVHMRPGDGDDSFVLRTGDGDVGASTEPLDSGWSLLTPEVRNISCGGGRTGTVTFDPRFDMDADADIEIDLRWSFGRFYIPRGELHYARFELMGSIAPGITIETSESTAVSCAWSLTSFLRERGVGVPKREWVTTFPVGPVPVAVTHTIEPSFDITVGGSVETGASTMSADVTLGFRAGAVYDREGGWRGIWDPQRSGSVSLTASEPGTLTVTAGAGGAVGYLAKLYDTAGPGVSLGPSMTGNFRVLPDRCTWEADASAGLGVTVRAKLDIPAFDYTLAEYSHSENLVSAQIAMSMGTFPWCEDGGTPDGGMPMGDGGGPSDPCEAAGATCQTCNETAGCGFCATTGTCMSDARATECGSDLDWQDGPSECEPCTGYGSCGACVGDAFCGWCASAGRCMTAESGGAPPEPCDDWQYSITPAMCR